MVQHNDKWKKKATKEYHRKHGTKPAAGRGRGFVSPSEPPPAASSGPPPQSSSSSDSDTDNEEDEESSVQEKPTRSKYARRKLESNSWRFELDLPADPHLSIRIP